MKFLKNCWYVAGWSADFKRDLLERKIVGQSLLFYRTLEGQPVAIGNTCPHRFVPLSMGRLVGNAVECGYHGLRFDGTGGCILNPHGDGKIPQKAKVSSYSLTEQDGIVWIWMGDREKADPSKTPRFTHLNSTDVRTLDGTQHMRGNYQLAVDNILDPSHAIFLHGNFHKTTNEKDFLESDYEVTSKDGTLFSRRWVPNAEGPILFMRNYPDPTVKVDHWVTVRWDPPGVLLVDIGVTLPGVSPEDGKRTFGAHLLTPETETSTHYFYAHSRNFRRDDPAADEGQREWQRVALGEQDKPMVEAQQRFLVDRDLMSLGPVLLQPDAAAVRARRMMTELLQRQGEYVPAVL